MRAVVLRRRNVEFVADHPEPALTEGECLVRVRLAGICATDLHLIDGYMSFDGVPGHEMVGTVEAGPSEWRGKRVVCEINCVCRKCDMCLAGLAGHCRNRTVLGIAGRDGCFADLLAVPVRNLHLVPEVISDEEAVFVEPLAAAYQVVAQCRIDASSRVTVVGPGRLGLLVAQVLAGTGCKLTAVGRNHMKLELCEKKGIQGIHVDDVVPRQDHDVVVECTGSPSGLELAMSLVRPRGTVVLKSTYAGRGAPNLAPIVVNEVTVLGSRCGPFPEAINALARHAVEVRSMISRIFPLEDAAAGFEAARRPENVKILLKAGST
jgi:threonine dehydrogenase-like Zn-dependent dehydrogenase